jgi:hypothetical protein
MTEIGEIIKAGSAVQGLVDIANEMDQETERLWFCEIIRPALGFFQDRDATYDGVNHIIDRGKSDHLAVILRS